MDRTRTLTIAAAGTLLVLVVYTAPLGAIAPVANDLAAGPSAQAWILSSMSLGLAAGLLASGAIADDHGRRRVFVAGLAVSAVATAVGALAGDPAVFVLGRILQGLGGAAVIACSLGLIAQAYPPGPERGRATGVWGASLGGGIAVGPLLATALDWRLAYWLMTVAAVLLAVAGQALLAESRSPAPRPVDGAGVVLLAGGLAAFLAGLVEGRSGWLRPTTLVLLAAAAVLVVSFVVVERRRPAPMIDLGLFRRPDFVGVTVAAFANGIGIISILSYASLLVERGLGGGTTTAAVLLLAWSATSVLSALAARRWAGRLPAAAEMGGALLGIAAGQVLLFGVNAGSPVTRLLPGLFVAGVASGVLNAALGRQAVASVPPERAAMGSGANNTARYVGAAIGVTVIAVIIGRSSDLFAGWDAATIVTAGFSVLGAAVVLAARERQPLNDRLEAPGPTERSFGR